MNQNAALLCTTLEMLHFRCSGLPLAISGNVVHSTSQECAEQAVHQLRPGASSGSVPGAGERLGWARGRVEQVVHATPCSALRAHSLVLLRPVGAAVQPHQAQLLHQLLIRLLEQAAAATRRHDCVMHQAQRATCSDSELRVYCASVVLLPGTSVAARSRRARRTAAAWAQRPGCAAACTRRGITKGSLCLLNCAVNRCLEKPSACLLPARPPNLARSHPASHLSSAGRSHLVAALKAARTQASAAVNRPGRASAAL